MEKCYEIKFHPAALKEFCSLDGSVKILVKKQMDKLKTQPFLGEELGKIIAIGKREEMQVYETAAERI